MHCEIKGAHISRGTKADWLHYCRELFIDIQTGHGFIRGGLFRLMKIILAQGSIIREE